MQRRLFVGFLLLLVTGTILVGLWYEHYYAVSAFLVWLVVEASLGRFSPWQWAPRRALTYKSLMSLYHQTDDHAQIQLAESLRRVEASSQGPEKEWLQEFRVLVSIKALIHKKKTHWRQAFMYEATPTFSTPDDDPIPTASEITEAASHVADRLWQLQEVCSGKFPELRAEARKLYRHITGDVFDPDTSLAIVNGMCDSMQRDYGISFLILNLIRSGNWQWARKIAKGLLNEYESLEIEEELRSGLYWMSEIYWFTHQRGTVITDYDSSIRYIYHLCFTQAERTGFLEVDSRYYSQFEAINELAREGFLFKEVLIETLIDTWSSHEGYFDGVFQLVMESMTLQKNKIYDEQSHWQRFWEREKESFSRDFLYLIEGNLCFAQGHYEDAYHFYERALQLNPELKPATFNSLLAAAKFDTHEHQQIVDRILGQRKMLPQAYYRIGNSFLLIGQVDKAETYFEKLRNYPEWKNKTDYYASIFCFEHGLYSNALEYAKRAFERDNNSSIRYHLSLCFNAMGEKEMALKAVRDLEQGPEWLRFYRFTLERDVGKAGEASKTLLEISSDYFNDPEELDAAIDFAKGRKDLVLLRHLKK